MCRLSRIRLFPEPVDFLACYAAPVVEAFRMSLTGVSVFEDNLEVTSSASTFGKIFAQVGTDTFGVERTDEVRRFGFP